MTTPSRHLLACRSPRPAFSPRFLFFVILFSSLAPSALSQPQFVQGMGSPSDAPSSVRGTVLNRVTREPIGRAVVYSPDQRFAMLTDDRGHFEFKFPPPDPEPPHEDPAATSADPAFRAYQFRIPQNYRPQGFLARKPGFLQSQRDLSNGGVPANQSEITIYLDPESLVVGHVTIPGSEGDLRINLELYRRDVREGQEHWEVADTFTTWADGEFRFSGLPPGTYKLLTREQMDRAFAPGEQLFGYPPVYYPGASDFPAAALIQLAPGATFQANLTVARRAYYPVKIPVANAPAGQRISLRVYPLGHPGPGYSLGYNPGEQSIRGMLPDGNYTLQAETQGRQPGSTGALNFSLHGAPLEGPSLHLIPGSFLAINIREEFKSGQSVFYDPPVAQSPQPDAERQSAPPLRGVNVQVTLAAIDDFGSAQSVYSKSAERTQPYALVIPDVRPGRYRVQVAPSLGYAASVVSGGVDLLRQPLIVGPGGSISPMEVTLRDDGASVDGAIDDPTKTIPKRDQTSSLCSPCYIYFLPVGESSAQFRQTGATADGSFNQEQLSPGTYRVLAFDRQQPQLEYASEEALRKFDSIGQLIHLEVGQKQHLRLTLISGSGPQ